MIYELYPIHDPRKSFYGKAHVFVRNGSKILISYKTEVCEITADGKFNQLWGGYSATTMRHINEFRQQNGLEKLSKKEWEALPLVD